jgi:rhodanese-related sulfurtransferase
MYQTLPLHQFHELHANLKAGEVILDVRNPDECAQARIAGSLNIPLPELLSRAGELKQFERIYVHCKRGGRARTACEQLGQHGFTNLICISDAGMDAWIEAGYPVEA